MKIAPQVTQVTLLTCKVNPIQFTPHPFPCHTLYLVLTRRGMTAPHPILTL